MSRTLPKFGYREPLDIAPELTPEFCEKISEVIDAEPAIEESFLAELRIVVHRFQLRKKVRSSFPLGMPTEAQKKANARVILENVSLLIEQLSGEAGGLKHYINNGISFHYSGRDIYPSTNKLLRYLRGVEFGCRDFLNEIALELSDIRYQQSHSHDDLNPLTYVAREIAVLIRDVLGETPTSYIYEGMSRRDQIDGRFARILKICFEHYDHRAKHDLRTLMRKTLKTL